MTNLIGLAIVAATVVAMGGGRLAIAPTEAEKTAEITKSKSGATTMTVTATVTVANTSLPPLVHQQILRLQMRVLFGSGMA